MVNVVSVVDIQLCQASYLYSINRSRRHQPQYNIVRIRTLTDTDDVHLLPRCRTTLKFLVFYREYNRDQGKLYLLIRLETTTTLKTDRHSNEPKLGILSLI